ncbi:MAG TPA: phytanoyl-CoA dioxygenase family protein [Rhizomicrobium sp.]|jgi:hypothetical protein|nr:phytanoyl-CoA dioxygenase family protein [Rhizomicrobium sp.]
MFELFRRFRRANIGTYHRDGFLVLPRFIPDHLVEDVNNEVAQLTSGGGGKYPKVTVDLIHHPFSGRKRLPEVPLEAFRGPVKINDLFLESDIIRKCVQYKPLLNILKRCLGGEPLICNSLNFLYGSQQPQHYDTWYMPPPVENAMAVASICLDDVTPDNGPLFYYPGSHRIPPFRFSHGRLEMVPQEMGECEKYVRASLASFSMRERQFYGKRGDVFIWHAQLLHGGAPIRDLSATRRSLVTHFWRAGDVQAERVLDTGRGFALKRDHPSI